MITAYHRPQTLDEAIRLISRASPRTLPLGGGTLLSHGQTESIEVVDLQALNLNRIEKRGNSLEIGATATLQQLLDDANCPESLRSGLQLEAPINMRYAATVAGSIVTCDGRSGFAATLLALDAGITMIRSDPPSLALGSMLPARSELLPGNLISKITIPLNAVSAFQYVARTPLDKPVVCAAVAQWPSGRTRLAVGGFGSAPLLAMDGTEADGLEVAAANAFHDSGDPDASAEFRMDVGKTLARRCMEMISAQ